VAVASQANQGDRQLGVVAAGPVRRGNVDFPHGTHPAAGRPVRLDGGIWLFTYLKRIGQVDFVIAVAYVVML